LADRLRSPTKHDRFCGGNIAFRQTSGARGVTIAVAVGINSVSATPVISWEDDLRLTARR